MELLDERKIIGLLPKADPLVHKYTKGYLLIIGGSRGMYGAPKLSSLAALRTGCGIVRFYYPEEDEAYLGEMPLELIHTPLSLVGIGQEEKRAGALLIGPGINAESCNIGTIQEILGQSHLPLIIDGGALPLFSQFEKEVQARPKILTPHRGEALKILGIKGPISDEKLIEKMLLFCTEKNAICLLKGAVTFLISKGRLPLVIPFGSVALATAGSGDVLAGMIASFVAKKISLYESAILGTYLHQLAGRWARDKESEQGVIASDLIEAIPHVYSTLLHTSDKTE
jgi:NAD(P)H-hydrate epimerase